MRQQGAPTPKQPAPAAGAPERGGCPGAARAMAPRQQPAKGAACPRLTGQAAGAGPSGQPVGHGRRPLTGACACALFEGCRRVRLRTVGTQARGRGIFKHGRNERRRRRLRRAGGLRSRPGRRGAAQLRRAARIARRRGHQRAAASPARRSCRTPAGSPAGGGISGAQLVSRWRAASGVRLSSLRRRARGVTPANHARARGRRYSGYSNNSSWASMSKGVSLGCLSSVLALFHVERRPRCTTGSSRYPPGRAGVGGALLRTPMAVRPLAAGKVRALPSHGQAGNSGCGAGGAAARRGRVWGACRHGRALRKM